MSQKYSKDQILIKKISYQTERLVDGLVFFDFYDPAQQIAIENYLKNTSVSYELFGGHPLTERKMLSISHESFNKVPWPISVCIADINFKANHRSLLGAIMGLGIERETIGDIIVDDDRVQVIAKDHMVDYISMNLKKLNNRHIKFKPANLDCITIKDPETKLVNITVNSMRADSIISAVYRFSRDKANQSIKRGNVKINHLRIVKPSHDVQIGDMFSVRGKGRFIVDDSSGLTRKGRNKLIVKKYV